MAQWPVHPYVSLARLVPAALLGLSLGDGEIAAQVRLPIGTSVDTVARGLQVPWGVGFAPDGRILVTERPGRIRVIENQRLRPEPWATLPVASNGAGLLGLAIAPDFETTKAVFVVGSFTVRDSVVENRLYRLRDREGVGTDAELLLGNLPSARAHGGSAVAFGPDGKLYVTLGDAFQPELAARVADLNGKILRIEPDGRPAAGNPHPGSPVFALGLRNPQGLAWDTATGTLFATDHGPSAWPWEDGRRHNDELNVIVGGANYGWPRVAGVSGANGLRDPIASWTPAIAPSGLALYDGPYAPWRTSLLVGALRGQHLRRLTLVRGGPQGWRVSAEEAIQVTDPPTRVRGVFVGRDGHVYVTTADRRAADSTPDDLLLRIRLPTTERGLTLARAQAALRGAEAEARRQGWSMAIAVVDPSGELVAFQRGDDVQPASVDLAIGKARTAARFRRPTRALAESVAQGRMGFMGVPGVVPLEGGVPIVLDRVVIGAVGVSGMTGAQDAQVAEAGVRAVTVP